MLSVMEWQLLSLNKILPQRVSPKPWVAFRARLAKVEEKPASTNIQKGGELLSDRIRVCFFTLTEEECPRGWCSFGMFCTDLSSNKRVVSVSCWQSCIEAFAVLSFWSWVWWNFFFFLPASLLEGMLFFLPSLPFQKYESKCLEELLFKRWTVSAVKVCRCLLVSRVPHASAERLPWAQDAVLVMLNCSTLLLKSAPAPPYHCPDSLLSSQISE